MEGGGEDDRGDLFVAGKGEEEDDIANQEFCVVYLVRGVFGTRYGEGSKGRWSVSLEVDWMCKGFAAGCAI